MLYCTLAHTPSLQCIYSHLCMSCATVVLSPFSLQDRLPLAVVGSNTIIEVNGKRVRGRQYPWGVAEGKESTDPSM